MAHVEVKLVNKASKKFVVELTGRQLALVSASLFAMTPQKEDPYSTFFSAAHKALSAAGEPVIHASAHSVGVGGDGSFNFGVLAPITVIEEPAAPSKDDEVVLTMTRAEARCVQTATHDVKLYDTLINAGV